MIHFSSRLRSPKMILAWLHLTVLFCSAAAAQAPLPLDSSCTVTVGNQTSLVRDDGIFLLQNVGIFQSPATGVAPQRFRVRATCARDGQMVTGQSRLFTLTPNQTTIVQEIFPTALDPVPIGLSVASPETFLLPGASVQLAVTGRYVDGGTRDLTAGSTGTVYLSSNPSSLQISEDGLVTSTHAEERNQSVLITVLNDGITATVLLTAIANPDDLDGDGLPNDYEDLYGFDRLTFDSFLDPDGDGLTSLQEFRIGTLPNHPDTDLDGIPDGIDSRPLDPESAPPVATVTAPAGGGPLFEGQTVRFAADAADDGRVAKVDLLVNGAVLATFTEPPYERTFNVPFGATRLVFEARATDSSGKTGTSAPVALDAVPDPRTTVRGVVQDLDGTPVSGATVSIRLHGLKGEFFDFSAPLSSLPDLTGLTPGAVRLVPDLGFRNPDNRLSPETFGLPFSPDYASRFKGRVLLPFSGSYEITLGADDGARLLIDGVPILEVGPGDTFQETTDVVDLDRGIHSIEIDSFQSLGSSELQLTVRGLGGGGGGALTAKALGSDLVDLLQDSSVSFSGTTGADGSFAIPGVPSILGPLRAEAAVTLGGLPRTGRTNETEPVPGGATDLGTLALDPPPACVTGTLTYGSCQSGPVTDPVDLYEQDPDTGELVLVDRITPDPTGRFCVLARRDRFYVLRRDGVACGSAAATCQAGLLLNDPKASGACGGADSRCQDAGNTGFFCDLFGG